MRHLTISRRILALCLSALLLPALGGCGGEAPPESSAPDMPSQSVSGTPADSAPTPVAWTGTGGGYARQELTALNEYGAVVDLCCLDGAVYAAVQTADGSAALVWDGDDAREIYAPESGSLLRLSGGGGRLFALEESAAGYALRILTPEGEITGTAAVEQPQGGVPALTADEQGRAYLQDDQRVQVFSRDGEALGAWEPPEDSVIDGMARLGDGGVYLLHFDWEVMTLLPLSGTDCDVERAREIPADLMALADAVDGDTPWAWNNSGLYSLEAGDVRPYVLWGSAASSGTDCKRLRS